MTAPTPNYADFELFMSGKSLADISRATNRPCVDVARGLGAIVDKMVANYPGDAKPRRGAVIHGPAHWYSQTWS